MQLSSEYNTRIFTSGIIRHKLQTTALTVAFVLVGMMMFLIPAITDKALGKTITMLWTTANIKGIAVFHT